MGHRGLGFQDVVYCIVKHWFEKLFYIKCDSVATTVAPIKHYSHDLDHNMVKHAIPVKSVQCSNISVRRQIKIAHTGDKASLDQCG